MMRCYLMLPIDSLLMMKIHSQRKMVDTTSRLLRVPKGAAEMAVQHNLKLKQMVPSRGVYCTSQETLVGTL